ncbi:MAG: hypothetical protein OJF50_005959 [Nitrospira sp.]|nr:hypothetical protein [Nitrospira sp.]
MSQIKFPSNLQKNVINISTHTCTIAGDLGSLPSFFMPNDMAATAWRFILSPHVSARS